MSVGRVRRGPWLRCYRELPNASARLVCFPQAGGGASFFRPWIEDLPDALELWVVQYPGREDRLNEPPVPDMAGLADLVAGALEPTLDRPLALFGHSMGASVAYEVTQRLEVRAPASVRALFVSARPAPARQLAYRTEVYLRDDAGLIAELGVLAGTDLRVLDHPELRDLVLPAIRNDFRLIETYRPAASEPLDIPVVAFTGDVDPRMTVEEAAAWVETTTRTFRLVVLEGGHFYVVPQRRAVITAVVQTLIDEEILMTDSQDMHHDLTEEGVRAAVAALLNLPPAAVAPEANLLELGIDSIKLMALASRWQRHRVEVSYGDLAATPTVAAWAHLLRAQVVGAP